MFNAKAGWPNCRDPGCWSRDLGKLASPYSCINTKTIFRENKAWTKPARLTNLAQLIKTIPHHHFNQAVTSSYKASKYRWRNVCVDIACFSFRNTRCIVELVQRCFKSNYDKSPQIKPLGVVLLSSWQFLLVLQWYASNGGGGINLTFYLHLQNSSGRCEEGSEVGSSVDEINTSQAGNPHALVLSTFETIWNAVCQFR